MVEEKLELSHNGLCDVNGCHQSVYGTFDGSDFCKEHFAYFTNVEAPPADPSEDTMVHPLLNPESSHYSMFDSVEAVERLEQMYTTEELMVWAKITGMKYRLRIGHKDDVTKEIKKIRTYEAYYKYLEEK